MDLNATMDTDSPVLWIGIDTDMTWLRTVTLQQPDYMWQYQLRYERDVVSQIEVSCYIKFISQFSFVFLELITWFLKKTLEGLLDRLNVKLLYDISKSNFPQIYSWK